MLKANAWPYSVFEDVRYSLASVRYGQLLLPSTESSKGVLVDGSSLRERSSGAITVKLAVETPAGDVCSHVFKPDDASEVTAGVRALCNESKFRKFFTADGNGNVAAELPLERLRGVVRLETMFLARKDTVTRDNTAISAGAVIGISPKPIIITLDEDWMGETIPVDWLHFGSRGLPTEAFIHVEFSGGSQVPRVWLNTAYRTQIEGVLVRIGDNSPAALAGAAVRQFVWQHVWERVVLWAEFTFAPTCTDICSWRRLRKCEDVRPS